MTFKDEFLTRIICDPVNAIIKLGSHWLRVSGVPGKLLEEIIFLPILSSVRNAMNSLLDDFDRDLEHFSDFTFSNTERGSEAFIGDDFVISKSHFLSHPLIFWFS